MSINPVTLLFDINSTAFTIWSYPMSYLELIGTAFGLISVWLVARNKVSTWPTGIINILFFMVLFYQIQLYSDVALQVYFLIMSVYGWWAWTHPAPGQAKGPKPEIELEVTRLRPKEHIFLVGIIGVTSVVIGTLSATIHLIFPDLFPLPAAFPYLDAFTSVLSVVAQFLMARRKLECWYLWIVADVIDIGLYFTKGVLLVGIEYIIFLLIAISGLWSWRRESKDEAGSKVEGRS